MKPRSNRLLPVLCLLAIALFSSGCVYLRLLQLKNQLAEFEKHFTIDTASGVQVTCRHPVLYDDDLRWLGIEPQSITRKADGEHWHVRWVKDPPEGVTESAVYDVELEAELRDRRLKSARIPERYFEFVSKDLFVSMLRSTGSARIEREKRRAEVRTGGSASAPANRPKLAAIESMLGLPTERTVADGVVRCLYRYRPLTTRGGRGKPIEVTFVFDQTNGDLRRLIGKLPKGTLNFVLSNQPSP